MAAPPPPIDSLHMKAGSRAAKDATARHANQDAADLGNLHHGCRQLIVRHCRMWLPLPPPIDGLHATADHVRPRMLLPAMPPRMRLTLVQVHLYIACMIYFCEVELAFSSPSRFFFHTQLLGLYHVCELSLHMCVCMGGYRHTKFT